MNTHVCNWSQVVYSRHLLIRTQILQSQVDWRSLAERNSAICIPIHQASLSGLWKVNSISRSSGTIFGSCLIQFWILTALDKRLSPMSPETISDGSAESDGSPVKLLGFNLEFLSQELIENIPHCFGRNIKCCLSLQIVRLSPFGSPPLTLTLTSLIRRWKFLSWPAWPAAGQVQSFYTQQWRFRLVLNFNTNIKLLSAKVYRVLAHNAKRKVVWTWSIKEVKYWMKSTSKWKWKNLNSMQLQNNLNDSKLQTQ